MRNFKDLIVWKKAHENALIIYELTKSFPKEEQYGITSQLRRASVSIPTNIAEGSGKFTQKDFANFLQISLGSSHETEYLILLSFDLKYINEYDYKNLNQSINEVKAMLISLIKKIR
ncbi:MAG: four helix bundle protein [Bacteroidota bacterium]|jgi:four helix bundle protein|nr:four helix bundle protein [Flammeovirgaceae bacterium]MCZ8072371.1 four helix bundle protein [Cytophagales bacterium]